MGDADRGERIGEESLDGVLRAFFGGEKADGGESVLLQIGRECGEAPEVLLRDPPEEHAPVLRDVEREGAGAVADDSRYEVQGEIGRGGVGVVYQARDRDLGRSVALKVLRPEHAENLDAVRRFVEEAQVEGQLQHPGIVPVHGLGLQPDGRPYFAMRLVRGRTLAERLEDREDAAADRARLLAIFERVVLAVAYAHERGVVHRDLKPANVMTGRFGEVQVMDWGFAKVLGRGDEGGEEPDLTIVATVRTEQDDSASIAGSVMGTPAYMPPEQAMGRVSEVDRRSDVFALGAILTEILTGGPPYVGDPADLLTMAMQARLDDAVLRLTTCGADRDWIELAKRCLAEERGDRPPSAGVVAGEVHRILADAEERARRAEVRVAEERVKRERERGRVEAERARANELAAEEAKARARAEAERREAAKEARRSRSERNGRRALAAAGAALCFLVVVAVGGLWWGQSESAGREREIEDRVSRALMQAEEHAGREEWGPASESARSAAELATEAREETRARVAAVAKRVEEGRSAAEATEAQAKKDRAMKARLEEALLACFSGGSREFALPTDPRRSDDALTAAFADYGINMERGEVEAAKCIGASAIRDDLVAALDQWLWSAAVEVQVSRDREGHFAQRADLLLEVLRRVDPDPLRDEVRAAIRGGDNSRLLPFLDDERLADCHPRFIADLCALLLFREHPDSGRAARVLPVLEGALEQRPNDFWLHYRLARVLSANEQPQAALTHRQITVSLRPDSAALWVELAAVHSHLGDSEGVRRALDRARQIEPGSPRDRVLRGILSLKEGDLDRAEKFAREALDLNQETANAWKLLGAVRTMRRKWDESAAFYRKAAALIPYDSWCRMEAAVALWLGDRRKQAEQEVRAALEVQPRDLGSWHFLGHVLRNRGALEESLAAVRRGLEIGPESGELHAELAETLIAMGKFEEAEKALDEAQRLEPTYANVWTQRTLLAEARGDSKARLAAARRGVRELPGTRTYMDLGGVHSELGDHSAARVAYREAQRLSGGGGARNRALGRNEVHTRALIGMELFFLGKIGDAQSAIREAKELDPSFDFVDECLANVHCDLGEFEKMLTVAESMLRRRETPLRWFLKAQALVSLGRPRESVAAARRGLALQKSLHPTAGGRLDPWELASHEGWARVTAAALPYLDRWEEAAAGTVEFESPDAPIGLAEFCVAKGHLEAAIRLYRMVLSQGDRASHPDTILWSAAGAAVRPGTAEGRAQALAWLRRFLGRQEEKLESTDFDDVVGVRRSLWDARKHRPLADLREKIDELPEEERVAWTELWKDFDALLARALKREP